MMRFVAVVLSACLLNCSFTMPAMAVKEHPSLLDPKVDNIDGRSLLHHENKFDDWSRIVGGSSASSGQFPYMASLRRYYGHFCGAAIISSTYLLTAGHCVYAVSPSSITLVVGTSTLSSGGTSYDLNKIVVHSNYSIYTFENDIGLLQTTSPISGSSVVASVPLGSSFLGPGFTVTLIGWGSTSSGGSLPDTLQFINLQTVGNADCAESHSPNPVFDTNLCTYTGFGEGACNGDSGGPLVYDGALVGLVSWGSSCAVGYPDVFTRVSSYIDWIQSNTV